MSPQWSVRASIFAGIVLPALSLADNNYAELLTTAVQQCQAVDPKKYQSGLILNPEGYRSYYLRSVCFQKVAVRYRDDRLCSQVRRRWSLFSSSWGYSRSNCEELVAEGIRSDRETIGQMRQEYQQGQVQITDFRIEPNGNGRDFDIVPEFDGDGAHAYMLRFELLPEESGGIPVLLHTSGFHLDGSNNNIRIYVTQADIRKRFPAFTLNQPYEVRATLVYSIGTGTQRGRWSEAFIASTFPARDRTQYLSRDVMF